MEFRFNMNTLDMLEQIKTQLPLQDPTAETALYWFGILKGYINGCIMVLKNHVLPLTAVNTIMNSGNEPNNVKPPILGKIDHDMKKELGTIPLDPKSKAKNEFLQEQTRKNTIRNTTNTVVMDGKVVPCDQLKNEQPSQSVKAVPKAKRSYPKRVYIDVEDYLRYLTPPLERVAHDSRFGGLSYEVCPLRQCEV